jgi:hypothetical protein
VGDGSEIAVPELLAIEIVGSDPGGTIGGHDDLSVGGGRG